MAPKSSAVLFAVLSVLAVALPVMSAAGSPPERAGEWQPIAHPNAPDVVRIANFAVAEYNKEKKASLVFASVVKGESQVVAGVNYRLVISAKSGGAAAPKSYTAVVFKSLKNTLSLVSFK